MIYRYFFFKKDHDNWGGETIRPHTHDRLTRGQRSDGPFSSVKTDRVWAPLVKKKPTCFKCNRWIPNR